MLTMCDKTYCPENMSMLIYVVGLIVIGFILGWMWRGIWKDVEKNTRNNK